MYTVRVVVVNAKQLSKKHGRDARGELDGFTGIDGNGVVAVVVPKLDGNNYSVKLETWGHELAHVVCGNWHE